ncbi:alpha-galactosidase [Lentilactobacillus curieae]|uniref:Alpha-galactosidase n=1 Tax=Lentilactobacillus curieae TaxID=1138822 RepID=A0A1S6QIK4_9LACO|nr:alpha-galactosidase [Lentilactobacillus curieae]AQW21429.1 alpha-galactosidase [Lentilactobacillus curieae]
MSITINDEKLIFHLQTKNTSYIFGVMENGQLGQIYYGKKVHSSDNYDNLQSREWRNAIPALDDEHNDFQLEMIKQEYSNFGTGDFRKPAFKVTEPNGSRITVLNYDSYQLLDGKSRIDAGLPSTFDDDGDGAKSLIIKLTDKLTGLNVYLNYSVFPNQDVIVRSTKFVNQGSSTLSLNRALSLQLDLPDKEYDMIHFHGSWARERELSRDSIHDGIQEIGSLRTASSHQENPFFILARHDTNEDQGAAFGFNLVYSGNFIDSVEVDQYRTTRVLVGINPEEFGWQLEPNQEFQTPEAVLSFSADGFNQLSQQLGEFYERHLVNPNFANELRPILINNWEATEFNINEQKLTSFAETAKKLGIEMMVLDDGWFGKRNDDTSSLGDWKVNHDKFPSGLGHLSQSIHNLGMKFGLWFEPEMISQNSDLYREHPEWLVVAPGRKPTPQRHQSVLDMSRTEVVDYLFESMAKIIKDNQIDYIKWDMNRNITEAFGLKLTSDQQLEFGHRYILGVYSLYQKLVDKFPNVLFESCASGGGRFDLGMMYYAPQAWTSDDTDAVERIKIQYGTSYGYPLSMMGAHISAVPNGLNGRQTPLATRGNVAFFGDFGYELDITSLDDDTLAEMKEQVEFYKQYRQVFQFGKFYRIESPFDTRGSYSSWEVVDGNQEVAIAGLYQTLQRPNDSYIRLYFKGLKEDAQYQVNNDPHVYYGDELMNAGYFVSHFNRDKRTGSVDFTSQLFIAKAK